MKAEDGGQRADGIGRILVDGDLAGAGGGGVFFFFFPLLFGGHYTRGGVGFQVNFFRPRSLEAKNQAKED